MMYVEFPVGGKEYKLRLNTRAIITLEKKLGKNPIFIYMNKENRNAPTVEEMLSVLEIALKEYHADVDAYDVFDAWLAEGHVVGEFSNVIVELYKNCGLFKNEQEEKN